MNYTLLLKGLFICCFLSMSISGMAQAEFQLVGKSLYEIRKTQEVVSYKIMPAFHNFNFGLEAPNTAPQVLSYQAPKTYSYHNLAFFCRMEVKMDKAAKMPVRFRLGTVDYVDRLEGKYR